MYIYHSYRCAIVDICIPVHVVGTRSGVVSQPDSKVLDLEGVLLLDLLDRDDLAGSLLELPQLPQEVPKPTQKMICLQSNSF